MFISKFKNEESIGKILSLLGIILIIIIIFNILNTFVLNSYDDPFTLNVLKYSSSYQDIISATALDVHPPLYYVIIKTIFNLFYFLKIPFNEVILGKIVSLLPVGLLLLFNFTEIRKKFDWLSTGIFTIFIVTMPYLLFYAFVIRMYTWALLFVTLTFYYAYKVTIESNIKNYALLTIFGILSAYTHYISLYNSVVIYLLLLIYFIVKNKGEIKKLLLSIVICIVSYLPWILTVLKETDISNQSSIHAQLSSLSAVLHMLWSILSYSGEASVTGILLLVSISFLLIYSLYQKNVKLGFINLGMVVLIIAIVITIILSVSIRDLANVQYLYPSLGCFYMMISLLLSKTYSKKKIFFPLLLIFLIVGLCNVTALIGGEKENEAVFLEIQNFSKDKIQETDIILNMYYSPMTLTYFIKNNNSYMLDNGKYDLDLVYQKKNKVINNILNKKMYKIYTVADNLSKYRKNNETVWIFNENDNDIYKLNDSLNTKGYTIEEEYKFKKMGLFVGSTDYIVYKIVNN
jgi:hypothetical protein